MSKKTIILGILLILWMGIIFYMSNTKGETSGEMSKDIVVFLVNKYDKLTNASTETINYHQSREFIDKANLVFRKICHFSEYFILSILSFGFLLSINKLSIVLCGIYSSIFSIIYAVIDEYHQTFINGRSGQAFDILIDSLGVLLGFLVIIIIKKGFYKTKKA